MTQKLIYQKPVIQVFELKQQSQLLAGSGGLENPSGFPNEGDPLAES